MPICPGRRLEPSSVSGHEAIDVRDIGLGGAEDQQVAAYAKQHNLALITRDFDFSDVRNYPPAEFAGIIVLELPDDAVAAAVVKVMESFLPSRSCSPNSRADWQSSSRGECGSVQRSPDVRREAG